VGLGAFFTNVLPNLEVAQPINDQRTNDESSKQRGEAGERGSESQIAKNSEWRKIVSGTAASKAIRLRSVIGRWSLVVGRLQLGQGG
jgi:hypothetical protein